MKRLILILILFSFFLPGSFPQSATFLEPVEFDYRYKSEIYSFIIDASTKREHRRRRIPGSLGIHNTESLSQFADTMDTETPLYIYCDGESRSITVAEYLGGRGFTRLYILDGGIRQWMAVGLPVDKNRLRRRND